MSSDRGPAAALTSQARELWECLAGAGARFAPAVSAVVSPGARLCPPGWAGIVVLGGAVLATAPDPAAARVLDQALGPRPAAALADAEALGRWLPLAGMLGPAVLAYLDPAEFRPPPGAVGRRTDQPGRPRPGSAPASRQRRRGGGERPGGDHLAGLRDPRVRPGRRGRGLPRLAPRHRAAERAHRPRRPRPRPRPGRRLRRRRPRDRSRQAAPVARPPARLEAGTPAPWASASSASRSASASSTNPGPATPPRQPAPPPRLAPPDPAAPPSGCRHPAARHPAGQPLGRAAPRCGCRGNVLGP